MAYVLLLDRLERLVLADRHVAAVLMAAGADDVTLPVFHEERAKFDKALVAEPKRLEAVDSEQMELRQALGVA